MNETREETVENIRRFTRQIVSGAGLDAGVTCEWNGNDIRVDIEGPDSEYFLENNARLLYALNHILHQAYFHRLDRESNVFVDCAGYRTVREKELQLLALKAAEKVRNSRVPFSLQPMPAGERRIIHLTLAQEAGIRTQSEGTGYNRKVLILPAV